ncbi:MAG TPA: alpha-galactosidase [Bryobacteraceae bacterium]|nr:alpha-galactosidase [Bryobacteraceae bacterium]
MKKLASMRGIAAALCLFSGYAAAQAGDAAAEARQWMGAKFVGTPEARPAVAYLLVHTKSGRIERNRRQDRTFRIAGTQYERGLGMPQPGEIVVHLPGPAAAFEAVVGVDSNDLGYYSNAGRGSVVASVEAGGVERFRSGVLHEGLTGVPVKANLGGATEFNLKLTAVGERSRTYQAEWDQADWAQARVTLANGQSLWLADLPQGPIPGAYTADPPFSFRYDGRPSSELLTSWHVERSSRPLDAHRTRYLVTYTDPRTGLIVRSVGIAYSDFPTVEWTVYLKNSGASPTPILEDIQAIDTRFERTPEGEFLLHHAKGSPNSPTDYRPLETRLEPKSETRIATTGGRPTDSDLCYFNVERAASGVIMALGWPGQWAARFTRDAEISLRVRAGQELTHLRLMPGEEIRTPLVALMFWNGDWIGAQNVWRRWMIADNLPRPGGHLPRPQLAGGSGRHTIEMQDANEQNQIEFLRRDLDAGIPLDYWWMDAGWYLFKTGWWNTGTWDPDPARFPHGFTPIAAAAHARGVKTIVWFEPERVTPGSWLYEHHPEWLLGKNGKDKLLYLGNPDARQWLVDHVSNLIRTEGIDLYRQDFNFEPLGIWRANDAEDRQGVTEIKHVTGYLAYWDELRRRFPDLPIDTCASGGRRNDLETLRRAVPLWRSDYAYEPAAMQQLTYGMALWIPYFGTAFNSLDPYIFRSQMAPAIGIGLEAGRYEHGYERLQARIGEWQRVADYYYGDFYPLTPYRTESTDWLAWQFDRPANGDGIVQAFRRPDSSFETARFRLRGLDPHARYTVTDIDAPGETVHMGSELLDDGMPVAIRNRPGAVILIYKRKSAEQ